MGQYKESHWYDNPSNWMKHVKYKPPWPRRAWWAQRFSRVATILELHGKQGSPVLDLGCGNGVFPAILHHKIDHVAPYTGIDFSVGSVGDAQKGNAAGGHPHARFHIGDIYDVAGLHQQHCMGLPNTVVVSMEVLEHLEDDLAVVRAIPEGLYTLVTVPMFDAAAHVRHFPEPADVWSRYAQYFDSYGQSVIGVWWRAASKGCFVFTGVRNSCQD